MEEDKKNNGSFEDLSLKENLLRGIYSYGFEVPSAIQSKAIPVLKTGKDIIAQAQSGTGKTHLAISFAIKALSKEYSVYFTTVSDLLYNLHIAKADNSYPRKLKQIVNYDLLILDELGFKQLPKYSSDDFFAIISKRYKHKSTIITTNKEIEEWNDIFDEEVLTRAIVDRLMHHASIFNIRGKSYRMKKFKKAEVK